ncbi:hypothetical protein AB6B38_00795 [Glycocaulis abyssi]|uniref:FUSC family protein n=1 Tax=Glycocaulis abyssi TaxID=1433403 RepID=A0ABV9NAD4_9PROT
MSGHDDGFDARLTGLFEEAAPPADHAFTSRVTGAVDRLAFLRPLLLVIAALLGVALASWQFGDLAGVLGTALFSIGSAAANAAGLQAIAMAIAALGLSALTLIAFRHGGADL